MVDCATHYFCSEFASTLCRTRLSRRRKLLKHRVRERKEDDVVIIGSNLQNVGGNDFVNDVLCREENDIVNVSSSMRYVERDDTVNVP